MVNSYREAKTGCVFVKRGLTTYVQTPMRRAKKKPENIIKCAHCDKVAVQIDGLWPYHQENTMCAEHKAQWGGTCPFSW